MTLDRAGIERRLPHAGAMCLLDAVTQWDAMKIHCVAAAADAMHPLARDGRLPAVAAIECAAQATAVHGALVQAEAAPRAGVLAKLSGVSLHIAYIPLPSGPLDVRAQRLSQGDAGCLYAFEVSSCNREPIASGRLMVAFAPPPAR
jgi:predicted hotdog family 3-hydroxylacyl-ACP dehydratase